MKPIILTILMCLLPLIALAQDIELTDAAVEQIVEDYNLRPYFNEAKALFPEFIAINFNFKEEKFTAIAIKQGTKSIQGIVLVFDENKSLVDKKYLEDWMSSIEKHRIFNDRDSIAVLTTGRSTFGAGIVDEHLHIYDFNGHYLKKIIVLQAADGYLYEVAGDDAPMVVVYENSFEDINGDGVKDIIQTPIKKWYDKKDRDKVIKEKRLPSITYVWEEYKFVKKEE